MPDTPGESQPDLRPAIVICAYDLAETAWDPIESLSGEPWSPTGARTVPVAADEPEALATVLARHLNDGSCRGMLLVGRTRQGSKFQIQTRAENRVPGARQRILGTAPGVARATVPVAEMVQALNEAGLAAAASSEAGDDSGDYLLFQALNALPEGSDAAAVGLLRAPPELDDEAVAAGVKLAATAIARHLTPLPRRRIS